MSEPTRIPTNTAELKQEYLQRCLALDLDPQVLMDGRLDSEIVIIGEGPGNHEVMQKMPFIGPSGSMLWNTLRQHHILRPACYVTNVSKRQVSLAKAQQDAIPADEWLKWQHLLHYELSCLTRPRYILALGNAALQAIHGWKGIKKYRGSVYDYTIERAGGGQHQVQVLYTFNPAAVLRTPTDEIIFQFDLRRFNQLTSGDYNEYKIETAYDLSFRDTMAEIKRYATQNLPTAVDIELTSGALACVGLANDPHSAVCLNFRDVLQNRYTVDQEVEISIALQELYQTLHASGNMIGQNGSFDSQYSGYHDLTDMPFNYDTLLAHHTLYPTLPHNLGFLTSMYTSHPFYKDEGDEWKETGDITTLWQYNGKDACCTLAAKNGTEAELKQQGLWDFFTGHVMKLQPHLVNSTINGMAVDLSVRTKIAEELEIVLAQKLEHFHHVAQVATGLPDTYKPNPNSSHQMKALLYQRLNLKHRSGSTDDNARTAMLSDPRTSNEAKEVLTALNVYKEDQKFYSTYATSRIDKDQRFRCDWKQYGVQSAPGRLSSAKTLWGTGMNMQNQPPKARQFYVADDDCVLIYFDLSQAEARVVGWHYDIEKWQEDFERARTEGGFDCHRSLAADMFKIPYDQTPADDRNDDDTEYTIRYIAKRCRHGLNYRMQIYRLAETTELPYSRAAAAFHAYHKTSPEVKRGWAETERIVRKDRMLFNAFGRRWKVLQRIDDDALTPIIAFYPQSTIGDKVSQVWYQSEEDDRWRPDLARIQLNVHDALIGIAHKSYAKTALSIMKGYAETPILVQNVYKTKVSPLIIPAECAISTLDIRDRKTKEIIKRDTYHRWSNLEKIKDIEAARV